MWRQRGKSLPRSTLDALKRGEPATALIILVRCSILNRQGFGGIFRGRPEFSYKPAIFWEAGFFHHWSLISLA